MTDAASCYLILLYLTVKRDNFVLRSLNHFVSSRALAVSSTHGVTTAMSVSVIKDAVCDSFARTIS